MNRQQVFDQICSHLLAQKKKSQTFHEGDQKFYCRYRGDNETKCAIGCLISDEEYSESFEGQSVYGADINALMKAKFETDSQIIALLASLQGIHDECDVSIWRNELLKIAQTWNLNWNQDEIKDDDVFACVILMLDENQNVLCVSRRNEPNNLGLPGGKRNPNETVWDCATREFVEETGISIRRWPLKRFFHRSVGENEHVLCFLVSKQTIWDKMDPFLVNQTNVDPKGTWEVEDGISVSWQPFERLTTSECTFAEFNKNLMEHWKTSKFCLGLGEKDNEE